MERKSLDVSLIVQETFAAFISDQSQFAFPLSLSNGSIQTHAAVSYPRNSVVTFQKALSQLEGILDHKTPLFLLLRRDDGLVAVTYVPHLANEDEKISYLANRSDLVRSLGESHFSSSLISKEVQEITDGRSWAERDGHGQSWNESCDLASERSSNGIKDLGYKKNRCRLCDRRMKFKIEERVDEALLGLDQSGYCTQLSVDLLNETLILNFRDTDVAPDQVSKRLPTEHPSFTFYRHPENRLLYFIWCSPDNAPVKERMTYTMAIAGLVNVITKDNGVELDQKIEIHDPRELVFEDGDKLAGKFRSIYLRNSIRGTESIWKNMEQDQKLLDSLE